MNTTTPIEGQVLDAMPAKAQQTGAMVAQSNPYLAMAEIALTSGKVDQLDRLLDLQLKWDAEQARRAFVAAMAEFKAEAGGITIVKSKHVSFQTSKGKTEYDHAELHDITRALVPFLAKHGLSHSWSVTQGSNGITVDCIMSHRAGHSERVSMTAPPDDSGGKNSIQAIASTKTYLERYTFLAATGMATGGELDTDGRSAEPPAEITYITDEQQTILRDLIDAYVINEPKFMDWVRGACRDPEIQALEEIPASCYSRVHDQLARIRKQKEGGSANAG